MSKVKFVRCWLGIYFRSIVVRVKWNFGISFSGERRAWAVVSYLPLNRKHACTWPIQYVRAMNFCFVRHFLWPLVSPFHLDVVCMMLLHAPNFSLFSFHAQKEATNSVSQILINLTFNYGFGRKVTQTQRMCKKFVQRMRLNSFHFSAFLLHSAETRNIFDLFHNINSSNARSTSEFDVYDVYFTDKILHSHSTLLFRVSTCVLHFHAQIFLGFT